MYFSNRTLEEIEGEYLSIYNKRQELLDKFLLRNYKNERAEEYAKQGFIRRMNTLVRCIDNVFEIFPPDREDIPTNEERLDATINLQAFIFNVFGSADNLAWICVHEKGLTRANGEPIPNSRVGLRKRNTLVWESFSREFQEYVQGLDDWFDHLEEFRHALAHRIPLYVPPHVVLKDNLAAYQNLEIRMSKALRLADFTEHDRLSAEQKTLIVFRPWMTHSFEEEARPVRFHAELLSGFNTIEALGRKIVEELDR